MRFEGLLERHQRGEPSQREAAEMLGVSERTFGDGATGCAMSDRRAYAIGGSASRRAVGLQPRATMGCSVSSTPTAAATNTPKAGEPVLAGPQRRLCGRPGRGRQRFRARSHRAGERDPGHPRGERRVGNDNTVKWRGLSLQIPLPAFCARHGALHEYPDRRLAIFHGPHRLADYDPEAELCDAPNWLREPLRQPACGLVDNATRRPQSHGPNHHRGGQLTYRST
jgi:hypothetical protein